MRKLRGTVNHKKYPTTLRPKKRSWSSSFKTLFSSSRGDSNINYGRPDFPFLVTVFILLAFGLFMVYDASAVKAFYDFGDGFRFLKYQAMWIGVGLILFYIFQKIDYHIFESLAVPIMIGTIVLLILVLIPGVGTEIYGAKRWIFGIQPSEFTKISVIIYFATWLTKKTKSKIKSHSFEIFLPFLFMIGIVAILLLLEPDLGTTVIIFGSSLLVYFLSGSQIWQFILSIPFLLLAGVGLIVLSPYRKARLLAFLDPSTDPGGISYHINQVLIALGSGGLTGLGLGSSRQKYQYIPEVYADSIFAIIGEEFGFIGTVIVILIFAFLFWRGWKIIENAPDEFGKLLSAGIIFWITLQVIVNIGAMTAIFPLTGIPLPFISYGGSALLSIMIGVGILTNISKQGNRR